MYFTKINDLEVSSLVLQLMFTVTTVLDTSKTLKMGRKTECSIRRCQSTYDFFSVLRTWSLLSIVLGHSLKNTTKRLGVENVLLCLPRLLSTLCDNQHKVLSLDLNLSVLENVTRHSYGRETKPYSIRETI